MRASSVAGAITVGLSGRCGTLQLESSQVRPRELTTGEALHLYLHAVGIASRRGGIAHSNNHHETALSQVPKKSPVRKSVSQAGHLNRIHPRLSKQAQGVSCPSAF